MARHRAMHATEPSPHRPVGHSCEAAAVRTAPLALWRIAAAFLRTLHMLFGAPEHIAAQHMLTAKAHAHLASWLRCAEAMLRRLLLIEASAYPKPNTRPLLRMPRKRVRKPIHVPADAPEQWRVHFRCFHTPRVARPTHAKAKGDAIRAFVFHEEPPAPRPSRPQARGKRVRHPPMLRQDRPWVYAKAPLSFRSAWPLAERFEALLRVFNDPTACARRIAARLHATPHRLAEALYAPPDARDRVDRFDDFDECAQRSWRPHLSSA